MKKRIISILTTILMLFAFMPTSALAEESEIEVPTDSEIIDGDVAETFVTSRSGLAGGGKLSKLSSTSAQCHGYSTMPTSTSGLTVKLYLEQYKNGEWVVYKSAQASTRGTEVAYTKVYTVESGYYYRLRLIHSADGETSKTSATGSIKF